MILDGEKLLADLKNRLTQLRAMAEMERETNDFTSLQFTRLQIGDLVSTIDLIKSGDYTIKEKEQNQ